MSGRRSFRERCLRYALRRVERVLPRTPAADRWVATLEFLAGHGRLPERRPRRLDDQVFALRVSGRLSDPLRRSVTCKERVKTYIAAVAGDRFNVATYRILRTPEEAASFRPERFPCIIKPAHGTGDVAYCGEPADAPAPEVLLGWLARDYYRSGRERNYLGLRRQIIVEEFLTEDGRTTVPEYQVWCFGGKARFAQAIHGKFTTDLGRRPQGCRRSFHDTGWRPLPVIGPTPDAFSAERPRQLPLLLALAERLAEPFDFLRVDFYATESEVRVGELTSCPNRGLSPFFSRSGQFLLGAYFDEAAD